MPSGSTFEFKRLNSFRMYRGIERQKQWVKTKMRQKHDASRTWNFWAGLSGAISASFGSQRTRLKIFQKLKRILPHDLARETCRQTTELIASVSRLKAAGWGIIVMGKVGKALAFARFSTEMQDDNSI